MTNAERFKTAEERREAYRKDCAYRAGQGETTFTPFEWLEIEHKEELKPCPFCGGTPVMADNIETMRSLSYYVRCTCGIRTVSALSERAAAGIWNRRTK